MVFTKWTVFLFSISLKKSSYFGHQLLLKNFVSCHFIYNLCYEIKIYLYHVFNFNRWALKWKDMVPYIHFRQKDAEKFFSNSTLIKMNKKKPRPCGTYAQIFKVLYENKPAKCLWVEGTYVQILMNAAVPLWIFLVFFFIKSKTLL